MARQLAPLVAVLLAGLAVAAGAQVVPPPPPNPGLIQNENERNRRQVEEQARPPAQPAIETGPAGATAAVKPGGATFVLRHVAFDASAFLTPRELDAAVAPFIGRALDQYQLARLLKRVNDLYARKGDTAARAFLPPQDLASGDLHIGFVEGRVGAVTITPGKQVSAAAVARIAPIEAGAPADIPRLGRDIAAYNRTHNAQLRAALQPGASFGLTDIALAVVEPPTTSLQLFIDNQGVYSVGKFEGGANLQLYGLLGHDDRLTVYAIGAGGNASINGALSVPFDASGGRIGASASYGHIVVYRGAYRDLHIRGDSDSFAVSGSQPLHLDQHWQFLVTGGFANTLSTSTQADIPVTHTATDKLTGGVTFGYTGAGFAASVSPSFSAAHSHFGVTDTRQHFTTVNGFANASLRLPADFTANALAAWQVASDRLIPGDQLFQIGGPTTVRGYPTGAVAGASGYYTNLEVHHPVTVAAQHLDVFGFYDRGEVYSTFPDRVKLDALGVGVTASLYRTLFGELSAGFPLSRSVDNQSGYSIYFRLTAHFQ